MELRCHVDGLLSKRCIGHQEDFMRLEDFADAPYLRHQIFVGLQSTCGIHNHAVSTCLEGLCQTRAC